MEIEFDGVDDEELVVEIDDDMPVVLEEEDCGICDITVLEKPVLELEPVDGVIELDVTGDGEPDLVAVIPGSDVVFEEDEEEFGRERTWERDGDHGLFLSYLRERLRKIPKHEGKTTVGCERAIAYLKRLDRELSRAIHTDETNLIDEEEAEKIRDKIFDDIAKLEKAVERLSDKKQRKKEAAVKFDRNIYARIGPGGEPQYYARAETEDGESMLRVTLVEPSDAVVTAYVNMENAGGLSKHASATSIMLTVDPFLDEVSRLIMRAHITHGKNLEDVYRFCAAKYDFTSRDHLAVHGLLRQKGLFLDKDFSRLGDSDIHAEESTFGTKIYPA